MLEGFSRGELFEAVAFGSLMMLVFVGMPMMVILAGMGLSPSKNRRAEGFWVATAALVLSAFFALLVNPLEGLVPH
jgi:hypothetical protein